MQVLQRHPELAGISMSRKRFRLGVMIVALAAGIWAIVGSLTLFPLLSENSDEGAYLSQAGSLRDGAIGPTAPTAIKDALKPWLAVDRGGRFVFKYAPVHAAMLAATDLLLDARAALAILAALAVFLVAALRA